MIVLLIICCLGLATVVVGQRIIIAEQADLLDEYRAYAVHTDKLIDDLQHLIERDLPVLLPRLPKHSAKGIDPVRMN